MDEMKITTKFMRGLLSKIVSTALRKKTGCDICIRLNDVNGQITFRCDTVPDTDLTINVLRLEVQAE